VRRGDDLWEADLVRAFHHMKLLTPGSPNYLVERSTRHQASRETLGSACGSPRLLHLRRQLVDQFMRYQRIAPRHVACSAVHDTDHKKLLDATLARDSRKGSHPRPHSHARRDRRSGQALEQALSPIIRVRAARPARVSVLGILRRWSRPPLVKGLLTLKAHTPLPQIPTPVRIEVRPFRCDRQVHVTCRRGCYIIEAETLL